MGFLNTKMKKSNKNSENCILNIKFGNKEIIKTFLSQTKDKLAKIFSKKIDDITDDEFLKKFTRAVKKGGNSRLKNVFNAKVVPPSEQVKILKRVLEDLPEQRVHRRRCKAEEKERFAQKLALKGEIIKQSNAGRKKWARRLKQLKKEGRENAEERLSAEIRNEILTEEWASSQWCTPATTPAFLSTSPYSKKMAQKIVVRKRKKGIECEVVKTQKGEYRIRYSGERIAASIRKTTCAWKRKNNGVGCTYCELSAEMQLFARWRLNMQYAEKKLKKIAKRARYSTGRRLLDSQSNREIAKVLLEDEMGDDFEGLAIIELIKKGKFRTLEELSLAAIDDVLEEAKRFDCKNQTTFEFLADGSALNQNEVSRNVLFGMMDKVFEAGFDSVALETRPEYVLEDNGAYLEEAILRWKGDGPFNLYIGLETIDEFFAGCVNHKGYGTKEFEKMVKLIERFSRGVKRKLNIVVYKILKSSYMNDFQSMQDSMNLARYVAKWAKKTGLVFDVKVEPAAVSNGSFQSYLYHKKTKGKDGEVDREFRPPNYFAVAELIVSLWKEGLHQLLRFGQRVDIDFFDAVSIVPSLGNKDKFSPIDFVVYNATQRFNLERDCSDVMRQFLVDLYMAIKYSEEFKKWEREFYGRVGGSELSKLFRKQRLSKENLSKEEQARINYQKKVFRALDKVEFNPRLAKRLQKDEKKRGKESVKMEKLFTFESLRARDEIASIFKKEGINFRELEYFIPLYDEIEGEKYYQGEIIIDSFDHKYQQTVWTQISLSARPMTKKYQAELGHIYGKGF